MGAAQSNGGGEDVKNLESKLRGIGDLAILERAFSHLTASSSQPTSPSVPLETFQKSIGLAPIYVDEKKYPELSKLASGIGHAVVQEFFGSELKEITWFHLLQGFEKCSQLSGTKGLNSLFTVYSRAADEWAGGTSSKKTVDEVPGSETSYDIVGYLTRAQLREFLWLCWLLMCYSRLPNDVTASTLEVSPPEIDHLVSAAAKMFDNSKANSSADSGSEEKLSVNEISTWVLSTIPGLGDCLVQFLRAQFERLPMTFKEFSEEKEHSLQKPGAEDPDNCEGKRETKETVEKTPLLLQSGVAWAIGLSLRDYMASDILFRAACELFRSPEKDYPTLIYRTSVHGRGMNRFWACTQGYQGLSLLLIMARTAEQDDESVPQGETFMIGGLIPGGFDNKESFYGASGSCLLVLDPVFLPIRPTGMEKNYVYSHKEIPGGSYKAKPKPQGVGFGGTTGKERIWIDEEYRTLTVRHHAVDKTYHAGSLVPNQGYAPIVAKIVEVEVWGLGGKTAEQGQAKFLQRESLFTEQRRKVDLKEMFGTWQNSPEKMMMDMVSDPNAPGREER